MTRLTRISSKTDLNSRVPDARYSRYEILNLSVAADSILQRVLRLEEEGFEFQPDAAILSVTAVDEQFIASHIRQALIQGVEPPPDYREVVQSVVRRARVNGKMPGVMIERRLQPYFTELCSGRSKGSHSSALNEEFVR